MPNNRRERVTEDVARAMATLIREIKDPRVNQGMITVTGVDLSPDLKYCRVYVSVLGLQNERDFARGLKSASGFLRRELATRLNLRVTPELTFTLDRSTERGAHINDILQSLDIQPEDTDDTEDDDE